MFTVGASVGSWFFCCATLSHISSFFRPPWLVYPFHPLSLGHIRLSCIPDIPAAYVRNSIRLLWPHTVSCTAPFPSLYPSPIPSVSTRLHLVCSGQGADVALLSGSPSPLLCLFSQLIPPPPLLLFLAVLSETVRQNHMTATVERLETGLYTWGNRVRRDNTQGYYTKDWAYLGPWMCIHGKDKKEGHSGVEQAARMIVCKQEGGNEQCTEQY